MIGRSWRKSISSNTGITAELTEHNLRGMTLLHLAASLGYSRLVCAMLHWKNENSSTLLETEIDALGQDEDGFTPLVFKQIYKK